MATETFGQMLRRLRRSRTATVRYYAGQDFMTKTGPMSQNELARQAGVVPAAVHRMELDRWSPRRETVEKLIDALQLDEADTARLLIAAGYWPWKMEQGEIDRIVGDVLIDVVGPPWRQTG